MSSLLSHLPDFTVAHFLRLVGIFVVALLLNRLLRVITNVLIKPAASEARAAKAREQQTRTVAEVLYSVGTKVVWAIALLTAASEFGINVTPAAALAGLASLALGFGAQNLVRDIITGFYIILEDQYVVGDNVQVGDTIGRVEYLSLRRTVIRDPRGALVTISNGDIRTVANLSRDWSQAFVDVALSPQIPQQTALQALDAAAAELRADSAWSQAIVDGPRILGLQIFDQNSSTVRLQVRTAPSRQDDVARELRRRIQLEFERRSIPVSGVQRVEFKAAPEMPVEPAPRATV
ncbi:MAG TPA: mechanosensitive ion channel family protein [Candidatus Acidoferrum sp.]|nr:mechanosensitive ion channel family protein [Candidatus Acidoferrum sp.]